MRTYNSEEVIQTQLKSVSVRLKVRGRLIQKIKVRVCFSAARVPTIRTLKSITLAKNPCFGCVPTTPDPNTSAKIS